ncbi:MAG TPA: MBL fold metallo-hydrolase, partial [Gemmatimonas sp.]|uniref:MBL fold metallo-hydrolase n=1 Tax=Gemmatimonas sp. TaxID=1962908 RepID=UPI002EDB3F92
TGEAIVVDPLRDIAPYLEVARAEGLRITHITETHIHADFVSGARELRAATGAQLFLSAEGGTDWQYAYAAADSATLLRDGAQIMVGNIRFDVLHTPGHTPEHLAFIVTDTPRAAGPMGILTGDFVFVGDVGRPDLLERAAKVANTMEAGARTLFRSLGRFRALPDHLQVWPGHGAGSACGKALGAVPSTTVGYEKLANWAVAETNEELFVQQVLAGQPEPPRYFADMKRINRDGPALLATRMPFDAMDASQVIDRLPSNETWVIDLRAASAFAEAHVPRTLSVPRVRSFSNWVGSLVPIGAEVILLSAVPLTAMPVSAMPVSAMPAHEAQIPEDVAQAAHDLTAIGFDRIVGWAGAEALLDAWTARGRAPGRVVQLTSSELAARQGVPPIVDVRGLSEWSGGHLPGAQHIPLGALPDRIAEIPEGPVVIQCQSGARSAIATSLLHRAGRTDAVNLVGGYQGWRAAGLATV